MTTQAASNFKTVLLSLKFNVVFKNNYIPLGLILFVFFPHSLLWRKYVFYILFCPIFLFNFLCNV
jgi:hypothetical protein